jgi:hypothetical protein
MLLDSQRAPEVSPEERVTAELIKRIRKLRWIGLDAEADIVRAELTSRRIIPADSVVAAPRE